MKERPILFSGLMVRALLADTKTQTRRIIKGRVPQWGEGAAYRDFCLTTIPCPYGNPGDQLWVKETFCPTVEGVAYRASTDSDGERCRRELGMHWKPSIFCTRKASRITLEITSVRVERLNDISEGDATWEGIEIPDDHDYVAAYRRLWESINGEGSWALNPWVWVIEFKRISP